MYLQTCRLHLNIYVCVLNTIASIDDLVGFVYIIRCSSTGETCFIHLFTRLLGVWCIIIRKVMSSNLDPYVIWKWIRHLLSALSNPSAESQSIMELNWTLYLFNLFLTSYTYIILIWSFNSCVGVYTHFLYPCQSEFLYWQREKGWKYLKGRTQIRYKYWLRIEAWRKPIKRGILKRFGDD